MRRADRTVVRLAAPFAIAALIAACSRSVAPTETPVFTCGSDQILDAEIPLRLEHVILAADGRAYAPCAGEHTVTHRELRELDVIGRALGSGDAALVRVGLQGLGRMGLDPRDLPGASGGAGETGSGFSEFLDHDDPRVREAAAIALADSLDGAVREPVSVAALVRATADRATGSDELAERIREAYGALERRLVVEADDAVIGTILETVARLPYSTDPERDEVETILAFHLAGAPRSTVRLAAASGLESLVRRSPRRPVATDTIGVLRAIVAEGSTASSTAENAAAVESLARARRLAMLALTVARDADVDTVEIAAGDPDWQVRRLAVARMNLDTPAQAALVTRALGDDAFQVRLEALRIAGRSVARTKVCAPIAAALADEEPMVVLAALDQLPEGCRETETLLPRVEALSATVGTSGDAWHVPARATVALARMDPERARPLLGTVAAHGAWQVRVAAAEVARLLQDETVAIRLAHDGLANVRVAGLRALSRLNSAEVFDAAVDALQGEDYDLVRSAAGFLEGAPDRPKVVEALLARLATLTDEASDISRDPRVAIVRRLGALMEPAELPKLAEFVDDADPHVGVAAIDAIKEINPDATVAPGAAARARYPHQPSPEAVAEASRHATIRLGDGALVELELFPDVAPVTVARFAELARAGYYDGLTFHRIAPNFVIQGGSPGANEYAGLPRYMRDEVGAPNGRGTVGLSTRGRDTADGQIFINLVDNARLNHEYTVFARVTSGMDAVDRVLEGARIESVTIR